MGQGSMSPNMRHWSLRLREVSLAVKRKEVLHTMSLNWKGFDTRRFYEGIVTFQRGWHQCGGRWQIRIAFLEEQTVEVIGNCNLSLAEDRKLASPAVEHSHQLQTRTGYPISTLEFHPPPVYSSASASASAPASLAYLSLYMCSSPGSASTSFPRISPKMLLSHLFTSLR